MHEVVISYRRDEAIGFAGRVCDRLRARFGEGAVLIDLDSVPFGADFRTFLVGAIARAAAVVAIIGPWWRKTSEGVVRLDDPRDSVRVELETALAHAIPVLPLLIGTAKIPAPEELPESLRALAFRNAIAVDPGRDFGRHADDVIRAIEPWVAAHAAAARPEPESVERAEALPLVQAGERKPVLELVSGPMKGTTWSLGKDRFLAGRSTSCDLHLASNRVSKYHFQLVREAGGYAVEDLGSSNGTYVNGRHVVGRQSLRDGDHIHMGDIILVYRAAGGDPPPARSPGSEDLRVLVHRVFFEGDVRPHFFINLTNASSTEVVEVTHVWFECAPQLHVLEPTRPLPKRLRPQETWETWIAAEALPPGYEPQVFTLGRARLSTGEVIASVENPSFPARGFVPGGASPPEEGGPA